MSTNIDPGKGWRLLHLGEYIGEGDEFLNPCGKDGWVKTADVGKVFSTKNTLIYRCRVIIPDTEWISVKDRLPTKDDGNCVLVFCHGVCRIYGSSDMSGVTHWRKLPEPPAPELSAKEKALQEWQGTSKTNHEDIAWVAGWEACEKAMKP